MGWETDQPPINYLKRRVIYYKKKRGSYRGIRGNSDYYFEYGGKAKFQKLVDDRIFWTEERIKEYEKAIKTLENADKRVRAKSKLQQP